MVVVSPKHIEVSIDEFPTTSLKKSTNTESIPVQVSLVVCTVNQLGTLGTEVGFELVGLVIFEEEVQRYDEPIGEVGFPPKTTLVDPHMFIVSSPASVGTFCSTFKNRVS